MGKRLCPWPPSLTQPNPNPGQSFALYLSRTLQGWAELQAQPEDKNNHPTIDFLFHHHLRLFSFSIRQDPNDFHSLSPPLPSPSVSTSPSSCRTSSSPFLWLSLRSLARSLAPFFFFFFYLIGIALFEMEKLFTLTAKAFGWRSYPEPLVMLLETMQQ